MDIWSASETALLCFRVLCHVSYVACGGADRSFQVPALRLSIRIRPHHFLWTYYLPGHLSIWLECGYYVDETQLVWTLGQCELAQRQQLCVCLASQVVIGPRYEKYDES